MKRCCVEKKGKKVLGYFWRSKLSWSVHLWLHWYQSCQRSFDHRSSSGLNFREEGILKSWCLELFKPLKVNPVSFNGIISTFAFLKGAGFPNIKTVFPATMKVSKFTLVFICMMTCMNKVETTYRQVFEFVLYYQILIGYWACSNSSILDDPS